MKKKVNKHTSRNSERSFIEGIIFILIVLIKYGDQLTKNKEVMVILLVFAIIGYQ